LFLEGPLCHPGGSLGGRPPDESELAIPQADVAISLPILWGFPFWDQGARPPPPVNELVLSLFPGIGILDTGFEEHGFCVVRGPDLLWGGDVKNFHPPSGVFDGVIGGPPCQMFSSLTHILRHRGYPIQENLIPEFERIVNEARPRWFVMENVIGAPIPQTQGYMVDDTLLNNRWLGEEQNRLHRFSFGTLGETKLKYRIALFENMRKSARVLARGSIAIGTSGPNRLRKLGHRNRAGLREACRLQGLPEEMFDHSPFTVEAAHKAIGNAVALPMARELARAVREAITNDTI